MKAINRAWHNHMYMNCTRFGCDVGFTCTAINTNLMILLSLAHVSHGCEMEMH